MIIPYGPWLPDQADLAKGSQTILNCAPNESGYVSLNGLSTYSDALTARVQGFFSTKDKVNNPYNFAGDASKLYSLHSTTWSDISRASGYTLSSTDRWEFAKYGNLAMGTNGFDPVQSYLLGASNFEDMGGTGTNRAPPLAKTIAVVGTFTLLGNVYDYRDGDMPHRVWWSPTNAPDGDWTESLSTQCDYRTFEGNGGRVQRIFGGEWATIFQENAIVRMSLVGAPTTFHADEIEERGTDAPGSCIKVGRDIYYKSKDGFYKFNGEFSEPIGAGKVDKTILADIDDSYLHRMSAQYDPDKHLIKWSYAGAGNTGGLPNKQVIYHEPSKKWSQAEVDMEMFANHITTGYTLEELDAFGNMDTLTDSLDSDVWKGGAETISAFNSSHQLAKFTGADLAATLDTAEDQMYPDRKGMIRELRPLIDGGTPVLTVGTRDNQVDAVAYGSAITQAPSGRYATRSTARYHRIRTTTSTTFTNAVGVNVTGIPRGSR